MIRSKQLIIMVLSFSLVSCISTNQLVNTEQIKIGMSIETVCNVTVLQTTIIEDPCMGYSKYFKEKKALILYNSNSTSYFVFRNITDSNFRASGGANSKLILITSSFEEASFYINNLLD
tara:strand:- start:8466 stop:8822 length:357 start_codon:yes stop_codon:yes gene_type:complete